MMNKDVVLNIENLSIAFGGLKAVDNLSFDIKRNEIFGLIGPNGAGKTTVFNCITQFYKPNTGTVEFRVKQQKTKTLFQKFIYSEKVLHGINSFLAVIKAIANWKIRLLNFPLKLVNRIPKINIKLMNQLDEAALQLHNLYQEDEAVNLVKKPVHKIINLGLARTFQNVELIRELSILDNLLVGAHIEYTTGFISHTLRTPKSVREEKELESKALQILEFLNLTDVKNHLVGGLSYGILKKVELGRVLMSNPKLIILDEPAAGLNDTETEQLAKTIRQIRDKFNCSILLVEHDMRLVMDICDRICAISFGKKLAIGTPSEIQSNKDVQEAYLGKEDE